VIGRRTVIAILAMGAFVPLLASPALAADVSPRPPIVAPVPMTGSTQGRAARVDLSALIAANRNRAPEDSGTGRRIVYDMNSMHVWLVEKDEAVTRDYPVSGHASVQLPRAGTYHVYSKSTLAYAYHPLNATMQYMVRFTVGPSGGTIGFHAIPRIFGKPMQTEAQLGTPLSSGCVRQSDSDALFLWNWAPIGTTVVVLH
jgi:hypothetical protein